MRSTNSRRVFVATSFVVLIAGGCECGAPAAPTFSVGGSVEGLSGAGLTLESSLGEQLDVAVDGDFSFTTPVAAGTELTISVVQQPLTPVQTCAVDPATFVVDRDVTDVKVRCVTNDYTVGGSVTGLAGTGLVLRNNGEDAAITADGTFAFATPLRSGQAYDVTVETQPVTPSQTCTVTSGVGTVGAADVTSVVVDCITNTFVVGGNVSGLEGTGLVLQNQLGDDLPISADGAFAFNTPVASGAMYAVTVLSQPTMRWQTCTVARGSGLVVDAASADIEITCTTNAYPVGGTVTGLSGSGLVLRNNGGDPVAVAADGAFTFDTEVRSGEPFDVTVGTQPTGPWQTCAVTGGTGTMLGAAVTAMTVNCETNAYAIGGTVTGLGGAGLELSLNGGAPLPVSAAGTFAFPTTLRSGAAYVVTIVEQPEQQWQTCTLSNGSGTVAGAAVTDVQVNCTTTRYPIGGTVSGLVGSGLVLETGAQTLSISADGAFTFATTVESGQPYAVTVAAQPTSPWQTCSVTSGAGTVASAAITGVTVVCVTNTYTVSGTISGIAGGQAVLQNNGVDDLTLTSNGAFTFSSPVRSGQPYAVTLASSPPGHLCTVVDGTGTISNASVTNVTVSCTLVQSCAAVLAINPAATSGTYSIDPDGPTGAPAFSAYCDMTAFGGGWTRCLSFTNTANEDVNNNSWFNTCVDASTAAWTGNDVMVVLRSGSGVLQYQAMGATVGAWTHDRLTSTAHPLFQCESGYHDRLIALTNGDRLMIAGRSSSNAGCGGSMGDGYGIVVYPSAPNSYWNPKMFVMPFRQQNEDAGNPRRFAGWSTSKEISWAGGASFNSCNFGTPSYLGTFEFYVR